MIHEVIDSTGEAIAVVLLNCPPDICVYTSRLVLLSILAREAPFCNGQHFKVAVLRASSC